MMYGRAEITQLVKSQAEGIAMSAKNTWIIIAIMSAIVLAAGCQAIEPTREGGIWCPDPIVVKEAP